MSVNSEESEDELSIPDEEEETINIGLYIGGRNSKGERDGRGWAILANGDQYDGQYRQGKRHGIGLYVFLGGARYFGQYRCGMVKMEGKAINILTQNLPGISIVLIGHRSGRGLFIYPDGSYYEGCWRKNLKHGKGRYCYANGDCYCGDWYYGLRHGIGIYTMQQSSVCNGTGNDPSTSPALRFKGTWRKGVRVGAFQLSYGNDDKCTTLHGTWDNMYPQGPAVFSFDNRNMLMGYFQTGGGKSRKTRKKCARNSVECLDEELDVEENDHNDVQGNWSLDEPSVWYAQEICSYDYALLPQEPVPLPLSDSDISICSIITVPPEITVEKHPVCAAEGEEEGGGESVECMPCECECSTSEVESSSQICSHRGRGVGDPCAIEIQNQKCM